MPKAEHHGQHIDDLVCEACFEYRQQWTHVSGIVSRNAEVVGYLKKRAGEEFVKDNGYSAERARLLRELALFFEEDGKQKKAELDKFIARG